MNRSFRLFVSSSPDLTLEREMLGQAVAGLPVSIGWEIKHTPGAGEDADEALAFIEGCDLYVMVLGADFAAPMGLEWERAQSCARPALAYRWQGRHSPSARSLLRQSTGMWEEYQSPAGLKARAARALARILLDRGEKYGLRLDDIEGLLRVVDSDKVQDPAGKERRRGAGKGAVILEATDR